MRVFVEVLESRQSVQDNICSSLAAISDPGAEAMQGEAITVPEAEALEAMQPPAESAVIAVATPPGEADSQTPIRIKASKKAIDV